MIISIHQGHFLPWLGYWNKVVNSDVFVWLDTVQFRKNYFQNRVNIKTIKGKKAWLTVPVTYNYGDLLSEVRIATENWKRKVLGTMTQNYARAPFYKAYYQEIAEIVDNASEKLDDLNYKLFMHLKNLLKLGAVETHKASSFTAKDDPSQRLVDICRHFNATHYIAGKGGTNYMKVELFEQAGIKIIWQEFLDNHPTYQQINGPFISGLSVIDCLFNIGREETVRITKEAWSL